MQSPSINVNNTFVKAIEKQNFEGAKIYAESAIRKKNEALNYRRLAARIDGVASQVQTAVTMRTVSCRACLIDSLIVCLIASLDA